MFEILGHLLYTKTACYIKHHIYPRYLDTLTAYPACRQIEEMMKTTGIQCISQWHISSLRGIIKYMY